MTIRVAVVGAGLAGLTATNRLVDDGADVTLFERAREPGGRAATSMHGAYRFNLGPHALYLSGEGHETLTRFGIDPVGHAPVQAKAKALLDGRLQTLPIGPGSLAVSRLLGPRDKLRFAVLLARITKIEPDTYLGMTVEEWASTFGPDPTMIRTLLAFMRLSTYANAPEISCAAAAVRQLQRAVEGGVSYLDGGWGQLITALRDRATVGGATYAHRQISSAQELLDEFDSVVLAVGGPEATEALVPSADLARRSGPAVEAAILELGVTRIPSTRFILGIDEPLYASVHAPPADLAPPGHSVICLARYLRPGEQHDADQTRESLMGLARLMGVGEADIAERRYLHRMTVAHGLPLASQGGLEGRPGVDAVGDPRIAIAGDWVGDKGLLADAAIVSGEQAARYLVRSLVAG